MWKDRYLELQKRYDTVSNERDRLSAVNIQLNKEVDSLRAEVFRLLDADRSKLHK